MTTWLKHVEEWKDCHRCPLGQQRDRICLARGNLPADVLFIGEAPGASEDAIGLPFVGPAGKLLDDIIERAIPVPDHGLWAALGFQPDAPWWAVLDAAKEQGKVPFDTAWITYALTNLVACFPREAKAEGINEPERGDILECRPRLHGFINLARPKLIVCVGKLAAHYVDHGMGVPCVDIIHPAAILRMPLAARQMALQRSIVQIRNGFEDAVQAGSTEFRPWGTYHAEGKTKREQLRDIYKLDEHGTVAGDDGIPF